MVKKYFNSWWIPSLVVLVVAIPFIFGLLTKSSFYSILLFVVLIGVFVAAIANFARKRWRNGFINLILFIVLFFLFAMMSMLQSMFGPSGDGFADNLSIPANIEIALPKDINSGFDITPQDVRKNSPSTSHSSLDLFNSFQPGLYIDAVWVNPGEAGSVYLKAFEITKGTPLSSDRLKKASIRPAEWSDKPKELFFSSKDITIYEGDWGKPYAARFEVWFVPDSGAAERKLIERIFEIEGWQR